MKKKWLSILLGMIILLSFSACQTSNRTSTNHQPPNSAMQNKDKKTDQEKESPSPSHTPLTEENAETVSKAEYDSIKTGMTYEEVRDIIGSDGVILSESGKKGDPIHKVTYSWNGEGTSDSTSSFLFENEKLKTKSEVGLQ